VTLHPPQRRVQSRARPRCRVGGSSTAAVMAATRDRAAVGLSLGATRDWRTELTAASQRSRTLRLTNDGFRRDRSSTLAEGDARGGDAGVAERPRAAETALPGTPADTRLRSPVDSRTNGCGVLRPSCSTAALRQPPLVPTVNCVEGVSARVGDALRAPSAEVDVGGRCGWVRRAPGVSYRRRFRRHL
jgi:hypothetical protein